MTRGINDNLNNQIVSTFLTSVCKLKPDQLNNFLKEFLTSDELLTLSKRFAIIYYLRKKRTSENIKNNLKVSMDDISYAKQISVNKIIENTIRELEAQEWAHVWERKIKEFVKAKK